MNQSRSMMIMTSSVSCVSDAFFFRIFCFYMCCHWTYQIRLTMSLKNLDFTPDPLVRTIFTVFISVFMSPLLVCWGLVCSHQWVSIPKLVFFASDDFVPTGVESKFGQLLAFFRRSNS